MSEPTPATEPLTLNSRYGLAHRSQCSLPTIRRYLRGELPMLASCRERIEEALREIGREDLIRPAPATPPRARRACSCAVSA